MVKEMHIFVLMEHVDPSEVNACSDGAKRAEKEAGDTILLHDSNLWCYGGTSSVHGLAFSKNCTYDLWQSFFPAFTWLTLPRHWSELIVLFCWKGNLACLCAHLFMVWQDWAWWMDRSQVVCVSWGPS